MFKYYLILGGISFLLCSCGDMFSTTPVVPRPVNINDYSKKLQNKGSLNYQVTESFVKSQGSSDTSYLNYNLQFKHISDSLIQSESVAKISMISTSNLDDNPLWEKSIYVYFNQSQIEAFSDSLLGNMGPRLFYLGSVDSNNITQFTNPLPLLAEGDGPLTFKKNLFEISRQLEKIDTVVYKNGLEESWVIQENWKIAGETVQEAHYWFGKSGLLKCIQKFDLIRSSNSAGQFEGKGQLVREFQLL